MSEKKLEQLRKKISETDGEGIEYLKKRFALSKDVAEIKQKTGAPVYDPEREIKVLGDGVGEFPENMESRIGSVLGTIMRVSRQIQYDMLFEKDSDPLNEKINSAVKNFSPETVACQGTSGSYSHIAAEKIFPGAVKIPVQTFEECIEKVKTGECCSALLPLENTTAGTVNDVYDLILGNSLHIVKSITIPIHHKLITLPGSKTENIRNVISHPQALAQCSKYIRKMGWQKIPVDNTAFAARKMLEMNDPSYCAIASVEAGSVNNLQIMEEDVCDFDHNQTRFVAIAKDFTAGDSSNRLSICFKTPHQSGSLAFVLNVFAERGLNMTKIQSRPVGDKPWEYSFWVDISANPGDENVALALYQLYRELPYIKVLGWYEDSVTED